MKVTNDGLNRDCSELSTFKPFAVLTHVESVVCLSREKVDDYVRISVHTKDLKVTKES